VFGRPEGCIPEHVRWVDSLAAAEGFEHSPPGELVQMTAEDRPVCDIAGRRPSSAERVRQATGTAGCQSI